MPLVLFSVCGSTTRNEHCRQIQRTQPCSWGSIEFTTFQGKSSSGTSVSVLGLLLYRFREGQLFSLSFPICRKAERSVVSGKGILFTGFVNSRTQAARVSPEWMLTGSSSPDAQHPSVSLRRVGGLGHKEPLRYPWRATDLHLWRE